MLTMLIVDSCAQRTLATAMVQWCMAKDYADAYSMINENLGEDLAGIETSIRAGLTCLAEDLNVPADDFISEKDLGPLYNATADQIIRALNCIHLQWISDNFTARRWAEKFFKGQLGQYRKTSKISFDELVKHLLFIQDYLKSGGCNVSIEEIRKAFEEFCFYDPGDEDLIDILCKAWDFRYQITDEIIRFRKKSYKKPELVSKIDAFLEEYTTPEERVSEMLAVI